MKKFWVLFALFAGPLVFYLLLTLGTINFSKLPIVSKNLDDISSFKSENDTLYSLDNKVSVVCFLGDNLLSKKTNALNLNEKIYKRFYTYTDFQMFAIVPYGKENDVKQLKKELGVTTDLKNWHFLFGTPEDIRIFFKSFKTNLKLDSSAYSPLAFIIDKKRNLRGRNDDEDSVNNILYGYDASIVSPIHKKMVDDVKVLLAEYRRAVKDKK
ncbi:MAG: hypothetical protein QM486_07630 [Flavobacteriaceae bacterium]